MRISNGDDVTIDHNTFYLGGVSAVRFHGIEGASLRVENMDRVGGRRDVGRASTVEERKETFGVGQGDRIGDPSFRDPAGGDFRIEPGSDAAGMAEDGGPVGMRRPPAGL